MNYSNDPRVSMVDMRNGGIIVAHNDPQCVLTPVSANNEAVPPLLAGERGAKEPLRAASVKMIKTALTTPEDLWVPFPYPDGEPAPWAGDDV